ncbi:MAG: glycoside hydrolase family 31 protein [Candidatus Caenarcaniphilales bacterium]|nr:glycoside hydrolase family 31 protein [Candidatus Caenarcaniphilales bacterium]
MGNSTHYGLRNFLDLETFESLASVYSGKQVFKLKLSSRNKYHKQKTFYLFIFFLNADIVRFHYSFTEEFNFDFNQMLDTDLVLDQSLKVLIEDTEEFLTFKTDNLQMKISKQALQISIYDLDGELLSKDLAEAGFCFDEGVKCYKTYQDLAEPPIIYGLGDKSGEINRWGKRFINKPVDALGYDASNSDPLYKDIPFFIVLDRLLKKAHGIFFDNFSEKFFDFGKERKPIPYYHFGAKAGELNYYFIYGPSVKEVSQNFINLTGKPPLMPALSFGYLGSAMAYTERAKSSEELKVYAEKHVSENIYPSAFHLSSGYTLNEKNERMQFIWNKEKFPELESFIKDFQDQGIELCVNLKPVLLLNHPYYQEAKTLDLFINNSSGEALVVDYWSGEGSYLDFSKTETIKWWKSKIKEAFLSKGIRGIWNDNNEYEIFTEHSQKNKTIIQANLMSKISYEASLEEKPDLRPWILTRSGYAGQQKYAQTWTGDNYSNFNSLKYDNTIISSMGISGLVHTGCDIGGFWGNEPSPELLLRWIQNGVFAPRFCIHSYKDDPTEVLQLKGSNDENISDLDIWPIAKSYMSLRDQLFPYVYQGNYLAATKAIPIQRPLAYDFQDDDRVLEESFQYLFGESIMIAPLYGDNFQDIYFPESKSWIDFFDFKEYEAGSTLTVNRQRKDLPVFVKANSVVPLLKPGERFHIDEGNLALNFRIFVNTNELKAKKSLEIKYYFYEDDANTNNYGKGEYLLQELLFKVVLNDKDVPKVELIENRREGGGISRYIINTECVYNEGLYN